MVEILGSTDAQGCPVGVDRQSGLGWPWGCPTALGYPTGLRYPCGLGRVAIAGWVILEDSVALV